MTEKPIRSLKMLRDDQGKTGSKATDCIYLLRETVFERILSLHGCVRDGASPCRVS